ncbi:S-layer homology domain-containing protein [Paenibacillus harenae]|uniref:S-layer homology domain-containing protein n=1 Tax=Paenibacillus harenae TaxID=306543 RepID=UPI00278DFA9B|nr:S-layer homology domain-containing protein [Paenibacillus harenae]MDQ0063117.1 hypothetical protein [Paenibacillus harenae]
MKKRWKSGIAGAALLLAVSFSASAFAAEEGAAAAFGDIAASSSKAQIESLQERGIVKGITEAEFGPELSMTNAQAISLIVRTTQISLAAIDFKKAPTADGYYTKVRNEAWYAEDFIIAHYNGLDIPADFDPRAPITKEQFVHYLVQAVEKTGEYPMVKMLIVTQDEEDITATYQGTINRALLYQIVSLDEEQNFNPQHVLTRAEGAAILHRTLQFIEAHQAQEQQPEQPEQLDQ